MNTCVCVCVKMAVMWSVLLPLEILRMVLGETETVCKLFMDVVREGGILPATVREFDALCDEWKGIKRKGKEFTVLEVLLPALGTKEVRTALYGATHAFLRPMVYDLGMPETIRMGGPSCSLVGTMFVTHEEDYDTGCLTKFSLPLHENPDVDLRATTAHIVPCVFELNTLCLNETTKVYVISSLGKLIVLREGCITTVLVTPYITKNVRLAGKDIIIRAYDDTYWCLRDDSEAGWVIFPEPHAPPLEHCCFMSTHLMYEFNHRVTVVDRVTGERKVDPIGSSIFTLVPVSSRSFLSMEKIRFIDGGDDISVDRKCSRVFIMENKGVLGASRKEVCVPSRVFTVFFV